MDWLWAQFQQQLATNQFFSGAFLTGVILGAVTMLKSHVIRLWYWVVGYFRITIEVHSDDPSYHVWLDWLKDQKFDQFKRRYRLREGLNMTPMYGEYCVWYRLRPVWINMVRDAQQQTGDSKPKEFVSVTLYSLRRTSAWVTKLMAELKVKYEDDSQKVVHIYDVTSGSGLEYVGRITRATPTTVLLPAGQLEALEADLQKFYASEAEYAAKGIPWRRGYLLYGLPGTGKTSLIRHLARKYASTVYLCSTRVVRADAKRPFLVFEDIDCYAGKFPRMSMVTKPATEEGDSPATPATTLDGYRGNIVGLLNQLDGIASMHGAVVIMTTNRKDDLDAALIRPGRVDYQLEFTWATQDQINTLAERFFPGIGPVDTAEPMTVAQVQARLQQAVTAEHARRLLGQCWGETPVAPEKLPELVLRDDD